MLALRDQAGPIQGLRRVFRNFEPRQITQCWQQVDQRDVNKTAAIGKIFRCMHDQGYTRSVIIEVFLEPESMLAQHVTVIGREQYHCIAAQPGLTQGIQQISDHIVKVGNVGQVTVPGCTHMRLGDAAIE